MTVQPQCIELRGARLHNLKSIDVEIPLGMITAICGVSGSGKSTLAIDTLLAEGQRRYIESFSPQVRQFLPKPDKPEYDSLARLPAAIGVQRRGASRSERTTLGSVTELEDYCRLIFAAAGILRCPSCRRLVNRDDASGVADWIAKQPRARAMICVDVEWQDPTELSMILADSQQSGFTRFVFSGRVWNIADDARDELAREVRELNAGLMIIDRVMTGEATPRLFESIETAFDMGDGELTILVELSKPDQHSVQQPPSETRRMLIEDRDFARFTFQESLRCVPCSREFPVPEPSLFSRRSENGSCPVCKGSGQATPRSDTSSENCTVCSGSGLNELARSFEIDGHSIVDLLDLSVERFSNWISSRREGSINLVELQEAIERSLAIAAAMIDLGLGYLTLKRPTKTLSDGERARCELVGIASSDLVGMLYVLDEPSNGCHPIEVAQIQKCLRQIQSRGNTVLLVEHDPLLLMAADHFIELGPGAGNQGGALCFVGRRDAFAKSGAPTAIRLQAPPPAQFFAKAPVNRERYGLTNACGNNLKSVSLQVPFRSLCAVTGVSGSGKSSLVMATLGPAIRHAIGGSGGESPLKFDRLHGHDAFNACLAIDSRLVSQTQRSSPATFTKIMDELRKLFASTPDAKRLGWTASHFSYNHSDGQCPRCRGAGKLTIDMHFMSDLETECPDCKGSGFGEASLSVRYRDRSIADCMTMSIADAEPFFRGQRSIQNKLRALNSLGLGHVVLGQRLSTLSAGELQRLKLSIALHEQKGEVLYLLDEPTAGLHFEDIDLLIQLLRGLVDAGNSVIVIEHNVQLISAADYVIELGPGAGEAGGQIIAEGTVEEIINSPTSRIGAFLANSRTPLGA